MFAMKRIATFFYIPAHVRTTKAVISSPKKKKNEQHEQHHMRMRASSNGNRHQRSLINFKCLIISY